MTPFVILRHFAHFCAGETIPPPKLGRWSTRGGKKRGRLWRRALAAAGFRGRGPHWPGGQPLIAARVGSDGRGMRKALDGGPRSWPRTVRPAART